MRCDASVGLPGLARRAIRGRAGLCQRSGAPLTLRYRNALVRGVSPSFSRAITRHPEAPDAARAAAQHAAYVQALRDAGLAVTALPADPELPDCCFVEDTALLAEGRALVCCPGAPARRAEVASVAAALPMPRLYADQLVPGATLDGGDCLRVGRRWYVGRSGRTNEAGIAAVRLAFPEYEVIPVPVVDLHLKSSCSDLGGSRVLLAEGTIDAEVFSGLELVFVHAEEAAAANVVALGDLVLVAAGFPRVAATLGALGYAVVPIAADELRKADGALTCLSLLWP